MADYGGLNNAKMSQKINPMQVLPYHAGWEVLRAEVKFCQARNHRQTFSLPEKGGVMGIVEYYLGPGGILICAMTPIALMLVQDYRDKWLREWRLKRIIDKL